MRLFFTEQNDYNSVTELSGTKNAQKAIINRRRIIFAYDSDNSYTEKNSRRMQEFLKSKGGISLNFNRGMAFFQLGSKAGKMLLHPLIMILILRFQP